MIYKYPGPWPATPDINLYEDDAVNWSDLPYQIFMAPGKYRIIVKDAEPTYTSPHTRLMDLEAQGKLIYRDLDPLRAGWPKNTHRFHAARRGRQRRPA